MNKAQKEAAERIFECRKEIAALKYAQWNRLVGLKQRNPETTTDLEIDLAREAVARAEIDVEEARIRCLGIRCLE